MNLTLNSRSEVASVFLKLILWRKMSNYVLKFYVRGFNQQSLSKSNLHHPHCVTSQTGKQMLPCYGTLQNNTGFRNMFLCLISYLISRLVLFRVFSGPDLRKPQRGVDQPAAVLPLIFTKVLKISDEMTGSQNTH